MRDVVRVSADRRGFHVSGTEDPPPSGLASKLFPDLTSQGSAIPNRFTFGCVWGFTPCPSEEFRLEPGWTWEEFLYGALRFWHAEAHCRSGRVVVDAACVADVDVGVLVVGSGKSFWAAEFAAVASVVSEDTVILTRQGAAVTAWGRRPDRISSRAGTILEIGNAGEFAGARITHVVHVEGSYGGGCVQWAPPSDKQSWLLQSAVGRILNTRSKPASLVRYYSGSLRSAAVIATAMTTWDVPCLHVVGPFDPAFVWDYLLQGTR